ncbi:MAG: HEAT repeat domain-containing protein [Planctomycetales bacterium]|nr:HEAT repeat domain-containing protein [Planctomycetales bacterium]
MIILKAEAVLNISRSGSGRSAMGLAALLVVLSQAMSVKGDIFRYRDGRVISGTVTDEKTKTIHEAPVRVWVVEVEKGVFIRVLESELVRNGYEPLSEARTQYAANVGSVEQTVETHAALAGECMKLGMPDLARAHFLRILDLDPLNSPARVATGYALDENRRWVKKEVVMGENRGKVFHKGRWWFPEMLAIEQSKEAAKDKALAASRDLVRWNATARTATGAHLQAALNGISQINDPLVAGTLIDYLLDTRRAAPPELKLMYVDVLSRFENPAVAQALARASMTDASEAVRNACLSALGRYGREAAIPVYVGYLGGKDVAQINSAAYGLRQLQAEGIFFPLLNALTTKQLQGGGGAGINASPTSGTFSTGASKPIEVEVQNQEVLNTLSAMTGQSFGFDRAAWIAWYANKYAPPAGDLRRDP